MHMIQLQNNFFNDTKWGKSSSCSTRGVHKMFKSKATTDYENNGPSWEIQFGAGWMTVV